MGPLVIVRPGSRRRTGSSRWSVRATSSHPGRSSSMTAASGSGSAGCGVRPPRLSESRMSVSITFVPSGQAALQAATLHASHRAIHTFLAWAELDGYRVDGRMLRLPPPRRPHKEATVFHVTQLRAILAACKRPEETLAVPAYWAGVWTAHQRAFWARCARPRRALRRDARLAGTRTCRAANSGPGPFAPANQRDGEQHRTPSPDPCRRATMGRLDRPRGVGCRRPHASNSGMTRVALTTQRGGVPCRR